MNRSTSPITVCPEHIQLLALAEGTLSDDEATIVSDHLEGCRSCDARFGAIEEQSDDLVRALAMLPATSDDEETFQSLQASLLANPEQFGDGNAADIFSADLPSNIVLPFDLGSYQLLEQIGAGANGAVFRAQHRRLEKQVAVKLLLNAAGPAVEDFLNEMRVIGKLHHPNVIQATDAGEHDGIYFLVMEYVPGVDVSSLLRRTGSLSVADACEIARRTALGLSVAHENDLVHRDVKTSNLLFTSAGDVKLLDLGLATISSQAANSSPEQSGPRGTADYMAPEQWHEASNVTASADIYSLGCTLFKLLTGSPPYRTLPDSVSSLEEAHVCGPVPSTNRSGRVIPSGLDALIRSMLAKSPQERPTTATEVAEKLRKFTVGSDLPALARNILPDAPIVETGINPVANTSSNMTRRATLAAGVAALAALAWRMNRETPRAQSINTNEWRSLSPVVPELISLKDRGGKANEYATIERRDAERQNTRKPDEAVDLLADDLTLKSAHPVMLHLGHPLTGSYRFRTVLSRKDWSTPAGLVFRLRANAPTKYDFQSFELLRNRSTWWLYWNSYSDDRTAKPTTLAETTCSVAHAERVTLEVAVGGSGFPSFVFNGQRLPQSMWTTASEARSLITTHNEQLAATYTGRIGVLHTQGSTIVRSPELIYTN